MTAQLKRCPGCGTVVLLDAARCYCGHAFRTQFAAATVGSPTVHAPAYPAGCPSCGGSPGRKVSAVVQQGLWDASSTGVSLGFGEFSQGGMMAMEGVSASRTAGGTLLARSLMPPPEPVRPKLGCGFVAALLGFLWGLSLMAVIFPLGFLQALICGGFLIGTVLGYRRGEDGYRLWHPRWREAISRWECLYYCDRCDCVYDPLGRSAPAPQMRALL